MLFLQYGVDEHGALIDIGQVRRGQTTVRCPYCGGLLIARKGEQVAHHFAHRAETCNPASRDMHELALPAYDNFNLHLPGRVVKALHTWAQSPDAADKTALENHQLLAWNDFKGRSGSYELTKTGKMVLGELSLNLFNQFQEPLIRTRHTELEQKARQARQTVDFETYLTDLRLYRAQLCRILTATLYFLKIGDGELYKIGVTTRSVAERVVEITSELRPHVGDVTISVLGSWEARGNVEFYFKHRYRTQQTPIGNLTEYFTFGDVKPVLADLRRMKAKQLDALEREVATQQRSDLEREIIGEQIEAKRRAAISVGLQQAAAKGTHIGRPKGSDSAEKVLAKAYAEPVRMALEAGYSLRDVAQLANVSLATVQKVKAALGERASATSLSVLTLADLPDTTDPQALLDFCAAQAGAVRWQRWAGGSCHETQEGVFVFNAADLAEMLYLGGTPLELRETLLDWLNTGKDHPLRRLRLTVGERRMLLRFQRWQLYNAALTVRERSITNKLVRKQLVQADLLTESFSLTTQGAAVQKRLLDRAGRTQLRSATQGGA